jgi:hypothetical protein
MNHGKCILCWQAIIIVLADYCEQCERIICKIDCSYASHTDDRRCASHTDDCRYTSHKRMRARCYVKLYASGRTWWNHMYWRSFSFAHLNLAYCDIPAIIDITACVRTPCAHLVAFEIKTTSLLTLFAAIMFAMKNLLAHSVCWRCADVYYSSCRYLISLRTLSFMRPPATCNQYKKYIIVYHYTHLSSQCVLGRFRIPLLRLRC